MSSVVPIWLPEQITRIGLLKRQCEAYEKAIKHLQQPDCDQGKQWVRELKLWRQMLKEEEEKA